MFLGSGACWAPLEARQVPVVRCQGQQQLLVFDSIHFVEHKDAGLGPRAGACRVAFYTGLLGLGAVSIMRGPRSVRRTLRRQSGCTPQPICPALHPAVRPARHNGRKDALRKSPAGLGHSYFSFSQKSLRCGKETIFCFWPNAKSMLQTPRATPRPPPGPHSLAPK